MTETPERPSARPGFFRRLFGAKGESAPAAESAPVAGSGEGPAAGSGQGPAAGSGQWAVGSREEGEGPAAGSGQWAVGSGEGPAAGSGQSAVGSREEGEGPAADSGEAAVAAGAAPLMDAGPVIATGAPVPVPEPPVAVAVDVVPVPGLPAVAGIALAPAAGSVPPGADASAAAEAGQDRAEAGAEQRRRGFFGRLFGRRDGPEAVEPPEPLQPPPGPVVAHPAALTWSTPQTPPSVAPPPVVPPPPPPVVLAPVVVPAALPPAEAPVTPPRVAVPVAPPAVPVKPVATEAPQVTAPLPEFLRRRDEPPAPPAAPPFAPPLAPPPAAPPAAEASAASAAPGVLNFSGEVRAEAAEQETPQLSWWQRLKSGLTRTSSSIGGAIGDLFTKRKLDATTLDDLEDILIQADLGLETAARVVEAVSKGRYGKNLNADQVKQILAEEVEAVLKPVAQPLLIDETKKPFVILVVGVNGAGKTTTIGKLAAKIRREGRRPMLVAGDTFRAAAIEQLKIWGERTQSPVLARPQGSDASGLAFDALGEAKAQGIDVLLVDTAGRLQNKTQLMAELEKIVRVMRKVDDTAPHAVLLVLDATVGQNALSQIDAFHKTAGVTGLVMTKLDGTARGGILVAASARFGLPVHFIGVGEGVDDLEAFEAEEFARAVAGLD